MSWFGEHFGQRIHPTKQASLATLSHNLNSLITLGALEDVDESVFRKAAEEADANWESYVDFQKRCHKNQFVTIRENELCSQNNAASLRELYAQSGIAAPRPSRARLVARELAKHEYEAVRPTRQVFSQPNQKKRRLQ